MYIKIFFPHGKGTGQAAVNYLTRMDYPGRTENPPVVLRGEPELTKALIASQDRQWKFCAGVLSWGPEDHVTPEQEQRLMDDFEQTAFAGLAPDQYAILGYVTVMQGITSCTCHSTDGTFHGQGPQPLSSRMAKRL